MATIDKQGNLVDFQGNTWDWEFEFHDDADGLVKSDISNWIIWFALKVNLTDDDSVALVKVSHQAGSGPHDDPINGYCVLRVGSDLTKPVPTNNAGNPYYYVIKRVIPQGSNPPLVETLEVGTMIVQNQGLQQDIPTP